MIPRLIVSCHGVIFKKVSSHFPSHIDCIHDSLDRFAYINILTSYTFSSHLSKRTKFSLPSHDLSRCKAVLY